MRTMHSGPLDVLTDAYPEDEEVMERFERALHDWKLRRNPTS